MNLRVLAAFLLFGAAAFSQEAKVVVPSDIADIRRVSDPRISPDGLNVAYVIATPGTGGEAERKHIWIVSTTGGQKPRPYAVSSDGSDSEPRWSPDGNSIAFLSTRKNSLLGTPDFEFHVAGAEEREDLKPFMDEKSSPAEGKGAQLWLLPAGGGEALPLTDISGGIKHPEWSPDGRSIAFIRRDGDTDKEHEDKKRKIDQQIMDTNYKFDRLWVFDLTTRQARLVTKSDVNIDDFSWSPDGSQIIARISPTPRMDDYWRVSKIVLLDAATGAIQRTIEERAGYATPRWSRLKKYVSYSRMRQLGITDEHVILNLETGSIHLLEGDTSGTVQEMDWTPDGQSVIAEVVEGAHTAVILLNVITGEAEHLGGFTGVASYVGSIGFSADGSRAVYLANSFTSPDDIWLKRGAESVRLTDTNPQVAQWKLGTEREISWKSGKDGKLIYGVAVLPPDYKKGVRYKTVVHIHGGPEEAWVNGWHGDWYDYAALLSSHGYVVLLPNPRGGDGQGPAFTEANFKDWGGGDYADVQSGVDKLVEDGIADPEKLVIGGWSFGGFMTAWTVTHTERYKAAMVGAGVTDLFSMATTTDIAPSFEDGYLGKWSTNREGYDAHSPVRFLGNCHTPVLVLHGGADSRVPLSQGQEFYYGLRFLGREAKMVVYPREPHIFGERGHQVDSLQRILDWYDEHLGPN